MKFQLTIKPLHEIQTDCLIIPVFKKQKMSAVASLIDQQTDGRIKQALESGDLDGEVRHTLLLHNLPNIAAKRILLVGCGVINKVNDEKLKQIITATMRALRYTEIKHITSALHTIDVKEHNLLWQIRQFIISTSQTMYQFSQFQSAVKEKFKINQMNFWLQDRSDTPFAKQAMREGSAFSKGISFCKDLAYMPANICTPQFLEKQAEKLATTYNTMTTEILDEKEMKRIGMNALLAVGQGSLKPPRLITMNYRGADENERPIVIIGKGITFDTGGINLKPSVGMSDMKFDMCGGATIFGVMKAIADLQLPINVVGMIAAAENMIGNNAIRPSDIIKSYSGKTIEILNTDAEGRLVLCDALAYCNKFNPAIVIDVATLTSSITIALGSGYSGLFCNNKSLAKSLIKAGNIAADKVWQLPMDSEIYHELLKSNVADIANCNIATREAGAILAACFLSAFTKKYQWAHIDIAATAHFRNLRQPTGRCVPLLLQYLINLCGNAYEEAAR